MARYRHIYREGEGVNAQRDLHVNGRAIPRPPQDIAGSRFHAHPEGYTGFAADGDWYQNGVKVPAGLSEHLGNDLHDLNTLKWAEGDIGAFAGADWSQSDAGLLVEMNGTSATAFRRVGNRWAFRGDFFVRLQVAACDIAPPAVDDVESVVYFGVSRLTDPTVLVQAQRQRTSEFDGFCVRVDDESFLESVAAAGVEDFEFRLRRRDGTLTLEVVYGDTALTLWSDDWPGIAVLHFGASGRPSVGDANWSATFVRLIHDWGWHDYSTRASWAAESGGGVLYETFWGDEVDPALWSTAQSGGASVACVPGVMSSAGPGLRLKTTGLFPVGGGGEARASLRALSGDFSLRVDFDFDEAGVDPNTGDSGDVDEIVQVRLRAGASWPSVDVSVCHDGEGAYYLRVLSRSSDADATPTTEEHVDLVTTGGRRQMRALIERCGRTLRVQVVEGDSILMDMESGTLLYAPVVISLAAVTATSRSAWEAFVSLVRVDSATSRDLSAWPTRFYAAGTAGDYETQNMQVGNVSIVGLDSRIPVWQAVGQGTVPGAGAELFGGQALPQGDVGAAWLDAREGVLWVPVANEDDTALSAFVAFDLRLDRVWLHRTSGLRRFGNVAEARVRHRQFAMGWAEDEAHVDFYAGPRKTIGGPLATWRYLDGNGQTVVVWVTAESGGVQVKRDEGEGAWTSLHLLYGFNNIAAVHVVDAALTPESEGVPPRIVASAVVSDDDGGPDEMVVCVYRDLDGLLDDAQEYLGTHGGGMGETLVTYPGPTGADAIYTGTGSAYTWASTQVAKLHCDADNVLGGALSVLVPPSELVSDGNRLPLIAVCHGGGFTLLQDTPTPADAPTISRLTPTGAGEDGVVTLAAQPVGIALTGDADIGSTPQEGWVVVQEEAREAGETPRVEVVSLALGRLVETLAPADVGLPEEAAPSGGGVAVIMGPPGLGGGVRLVWGYLEDEGLVEWDLWSVSRASWSGPHYGGTKIEVNGVGLDLLTRLYVGAVACKRWRRTLEDDGTVTVSGVTPSVGWIINDPPGPVVADALVEASTTWAYPVTLRTNNGDTLTLPDGFTYTSDLETEQTLRRTLARLPSAWLDTDPKADTMQRHLLLAAARLFTRLRADALLPTLAGIAISTSTGSALDLWGSHLRCPRAYPQMPDTAFRVLLKAVLAFGYSGPTPTRMLDILEPILGVRPTFTEAYRQITFTAALGGVSAALANHDFFGNVVALDDEEKLGRAFLDRDFWYGPDARVVGANRALFKYRPAGVRATLRIIVE